MKNIGIMQGRLLPPVGDRIQAFPGKAWTEEFRSGAEIGISSVEWILESPLDSNPLWSDEGRKEIQSIQEKTGVVVEYVCADYFMEYPLVRMSEPVRQMNQEILKLAIGHCASLGIKGIEIPMVDASRIENRNEEDELASSLEPCLDYASSLGIEIGLETSLDPEGFRALLERIGHPAIRANYDSGNSASLGYKADEEIDAYGSWINNVHIKDRILGGTTVSLGEGDADIPGVLQALKRAEYRGGYIIQGARQGTPERETICRYAAQISDWLVEADQG